MGFERRGTPKAAREHKCPLPVYNPFWLRWRQGARWRCGRRPNVEPFGVCIGGCGQLYERRVEFGMDGESYWKAIEG